MFSCFSRGVSSFNKFIPEFDFVDPESEYESEYTTDSDDEDSGPSSPCSQTSRLSRSGSIARSGSFRRYSLLKRLWRRLTWPIRFVLRVLRISGSYSGGNLSNLTPMASRSGIDEPGSLRRSSGSAGSFNKMFHAASKHFTDMKDLLVNHRTTDSRRRGIVEVST